MAAGSEQNAGGIQLARALELRGWSQGRAETELELSSGFVSRLVSGRRKPGRALALRIFATLGIDPLLWDQPLSPARDLDAPIPYRLTDKG